MTLCRWGQVAALLVGAAIAAMPGCDLSHHAAVTEYTSSAEPATILNESDLAPDTPPSQRAIVRLSGSPFEVDLATRKDKNRFQIMLSKDGVEFDREEYVDAYNGFKLAEAAGETYSPPIDLLRYPTKLGDSWDWSGEIRLVDDARKANAHIETMEETQYIGEVPVKAVKVRVELKFETAPEVHAERTLTFWFAPKRGLFKRQYDTVSVREPRP